MNLKVILLSNFLMIFSPFCKLEAFRLKRSSGQPLVFQGFFSLGANSNLNQVRYLKNLTLLPHNPLTLLPCSPFKLHANFFYRNCSNNRLNGLILEIAPHATFSLPVIFFLGNPLGTVNIFSSGIPFIRNGSDKLFKTLNAFIFTSPPYELFKNKKIKLHLSLALLDSLEAMILGYAAYRIKQVDVRASCNYLCGKMNETLDVKSKRLNFSLGLNFLQVFHIFGSEKLDPEFNHAEFMLNELSDLNALKHQKITDAQNETAAQRREKLIEKEKKKSIEEVAYLKRALSRSEMQLQNTDSKLIDQYKLTNDQYKLIDKIRESTFDEIQTLKISIEHLKQEKNLIASDLRDKDNIIHQKDSDLERTNRHLEEMSKAVGVGMSEWLIAHFDQNAAVIHELTQTVQVQRFSDLRSRARILSKERLIDHLLRQDEKSLDTIQFLDHENLLLRGQLQVENQPGEITLPKESELVSHLKERITGLKAFMEYYRENYKNDLETMHLGYQQYFKFLFKKLENVNQAVLKLSLKFLDQRLCDPQRGALVLMELEKDFEENFKKDIQIDQRRREIDQRRPREDDRNLILRLIDPTPGIEPEEEFEGPQLAWIDDPEVSLVAKIYEGNLAILSKELQRLRKNAIDDQIRFKRFVYQFGDCLSKFLKDYEQLGDLKEIFSFTCGNHWEAIQKFVSQSRDELQTNWDYFLNPNCQQKPPKPRFQFELVPYYGNEKKSDPEVEEFKEILPRLHS